MELVNMLSGTVTQYAITLAPVSSVLEHGRHEKQYGSRVGSKLGKTRAGLPAASEVDAAPIRHTEHARTAPGRRRLRCSPPPQLNSVTCISSSESEFPQLKASAMLEDVERCEAHEEARLVTCWWKLAGGLPSPGLASTAPLLRKRGVRTRR